MIGKAPHLRDSGRTPPPRSASRKPRRTSSCCFRARWWPGCICDCKRKVSVLCGQTMCQDLGNAQYVPTHTLVPLLRARFGYPENNPTGVTHPHRAVRVNHGGGVYEGVQRGLPETPRRANGREEILGRLVRGTPPAIGAASPGGPRRTDHVRCFGVGVWV